ncbi:MAG: TIGR00282 family metallophosphoesterase [Candidatus Omnitrophota bacterium]|jgi:metallophosphoesterase (TIGR00282 family)|nr:MAG: TIGR00282 family metallophosphoesterase [Candidatus Omnitrophota bacterium]
MKILFIGDIVGSPGREAIEKLLPGAKEEYGVDFVIANAENAAGGSGIIPRIAAQLFDAGVDVLTSGDHIWKKKEIFEVIDKDRRILRPCNFPDGTPGYGWGVFSDRKGNKVGVINVNGRVFMDPLECPFRATLKCSEEIAKETKVVIVDMHAEATSEKVALGWYLDGHVSAVLGTHTHIQTADERVLPKGTAFITDVGMTGPCDSVIGRKVEDVLQRFLTLIPTRFNVAEDNVKMQGAIVDIDENNGLARSILRLQKGY